MPPRTAWYISAINRCVDILTQSKKISFFGLGASSAVARDAQNKFFRLQHPRGELRGHRHDAHELHQQQRRGRGGPHLPHRPHQGPGGNCRAGPGKRCHHHRHDRQGLSLARECNLVLSMDVPEDTDVYMPMASRIAQLALVDVLATGSPCAVA